MTGGALLGLILLSMAWLFFLAGLVVNFSALRAAMKRQEADTEARPRPSGMGFMPGVVGSLAVFFSIPVLQRWLGIEVPWPWLWILLPLLLDPYCLGGLALLVLQRLRRSGSG